MVVIVYISFFNSYISIVDVEGPFVTVELAEQFLLEKGYEKRHDKLGGRGGHTNITYQKSNCAAYIREVKDY